ncbi:MAG: histidine triad (HIT) family protein [Paraglaciecola sp.]|jgi:histidine triad (HIT) family protein
MINAIDYPADLKMRRIIKTFEFIRRVPMQRYMSLISIIAIFFIVFHAKTIASEKTVASIGLYDSHNPFARILRGELPAKVVFENEYVLAFHDIRPAAPVHILVIPKGAYRSMAEFSEKATDKEALALIRAFGQVAGIMHVKESGFRLVSNAGHDANQTVPHLHFHLVGGKPLGTSMN